MAQQPKNAVLFGFGALCALRVHARAFAGALCALALPAALACTPAPDGGTETDGLETTSGGASDSASDGGGSSSTGASSSGAATSGASDMSTGTGDSEGTAGTTAGAEDPCAACSDGQICVATLTSDACVFDSPYSYDCVARPPECEDELSCGGACLQALCGSGGTCETYDCDPPAEFAVDFVCGLSPLGGCDVWAQDCPEGEKCVPDELTDTTCVPLGARQLGESCAGASEDDCAEGLVCSELASGDGPVCAPMCMGAPEEPDCAHAGDESVCLYGQLLAPACLPSCDPLAGACGAGSLCMPHPHTGEFLCGADASEDGVGPGSACGLVNSCGPGLVCASGALLPECAEDGCCTAYCDYGALDADLDGQYDDGVDAATGCEALPGTVCVAWYEELDQAPAQWQHVGACVEP